MTAYTFRTEYNKPMLTAIERKRERAKEWARKRRLENGRRPSYAAPEQLVELLSVPVPEAGCQLWIGEINHNGYGRTMIKGKTWLAHRLSWSLRHGEIPEGMVVCHKCDTRSCVNTDHLFLGSPADNMHDMARKGRAQKGEARPLAKLRESDVVAIRLAGGPHSSIGQQFGVSRGLVSQIKRGHGWRHI